MRLSDITKPKTQLILTEEDSSGFMSDPAAIKAWMEETLSKKYSNVKYEISNGYVNIIEAYIVEFSPHFLVNGRIPVRFGTWKGSLRFISYPGDKSRCLSSMEGCPKVINGSFSATGQNLKSLEGIPEYLNKGCNIENNPIVTAQGIHKLIKYCEQRLILPGQIRSHILGVLLIPGVDDFRLSKDGVFDDSRNVCFKVSQIMRTHLAGDRDILECQEELRTAGLREYGKL